MDVEKGFLYFNSSMVRLKVFSTMQLIIIINDFNSSMVRLKEKQKIIMKINKEFQFQYGEIKRMVEYALSQLDAISIPVW